MGYDNLFKEVPVVSRIHWTLTTLFRWLFLPFLLGADDFSELWQRALFAGNWYDYTDYFLRKKPVRVEMALRSYRQHNADVRQNCPKDKMLVIDSLPPNWEELCEFVGKPNPGVEYPDINKGGTVVDEFRKGKFGELEKAGKRNALIKLSCIAVVIAFLVKFVF